METLLAATQVSEGLRLASLLGFAGFFCLAATVVLGIVRALDLWGARVSGAAIEQLHLAVAVGGLAGLSGHIAAHCVREAGGMAIWEAFVPFAFGGWVVAAGVVAWLLLLGVTLAVPFRAAIGYRGWLRLHRVAYAAAGLAALHVVVAADPLTHGTLVNVAVVLTVAGVLAAVRLRLRGADDFRSMHRATPGVAEVDR